MMQRSSSTVITSRQHPLCKLVRSLHAAKGRRESGLFLIEGANSVDAALKVNWPLRHIFIADGTETDSWSAPATTAQIATHIMPAALMQYISEAQTPTEVLAVGVLNNAPLIMQTRLADDELILVLDGISDPGNVGTLLRSADVAGAKQCIVANNSADAFGPKAVRASAGSVFHLAVTNADSDAITDALGTADIPLIAAVAHGGEDCFSFQWPRCCGLVLGHETRGVSQALQAATSHGVTIPNYGRAESLNVAAAGAILLFAWRQSLHDERCCFIETP